tara:strand:+ start:109 stop:429 length:321 start_codon:yes stop_codon:yes gene_type:complete
MAKIDELSELLCSELASFEQHMKRLEEIHSQGIHLDTEDLIRRLSSLEDTMDFEKNEYERISAELSNTIKEAKIYPKWALVVFFVSLSLNIIVITYFILKMFKVIG